MCLCLCVCVFLCVCMCVSMCLCVSVCLCVSLSMCIFARKHNNNARTRRVAVGAGGNARRDVDAPIVADFDGGRGDLLVGEGARPVGREVDVLVLEEAAEAARRGCEQKQCTCVHERGWVGGWVGVSGCGYGFGQSLRERCARPRNRTCK